MTASHALSQLSYSPKRIIDGHLNTDELAVSRRSEAQMRVRAMLELVDWKEETAIELVTVGGDTVDLGCAVGRPDVAS